MTDGLPDGFGPNDPTAGDRAETDHTGISFSIKEHGRGEPWVMFEEDSPGLPVLRRGDAFLGLQCRAGISFAEAQRFVSEMNRMFDTLSYTRFIT